jgi:putative transposase
VRKSKFTAQQVAHAVHQVDAGVPVAEVCRKFGVSAQTFYRWKRRYGGMGPSEVQRLKQLEEECRRLKAIVADLTLDKQMLQEVLRKKA